MSLSDLDLETRLHDHRLSAADAVAPADLAERVRQRYRRQQRQRLGLAAAALAVAAVVVLVPRVGGSLVDDGDVAPASPAPVHTPSLFDVPTRGSLADDEAWVAGVAVLSGSPEEGDPDDVPADLPLGDRHVVFAGEIPGGRAAFVLARADRVLFGVWFTGPEGARPGQMQPAVDPFLVRDGYPQALWDVPVSGSEEGVLVVLGQPDDALTYMSGMDISDDGHFREVWHPLPAEDGVAVASLPRGPTGFGPGQVRAGDGRPVKPMPTDVVVGEPAPVEPADPRGLLAGVPQGNVEAAVSSLAGFFALPATRLDPVLLWAGPDDANSPESTLLIGVTLPSGATAVCAMTFRPDGGIPFIEGSPLIVAAPAGPGTALLDRTIAVPTADGLVVVGPRDGVRAEALENGAVVTTFPLVDGGGATLLPELTYPDTVRVLDAGGAVLAETTARPETMS
jgi:hypothetical protein